MGLGILDVHSIVRSTGLEHIRRGIRRRMHWPGDSQPVCDRAVLGPTKRAGVKRTEWPEFFRKFGPEQGRRAPTVRLTWAHVALLRSSLRTLDRSVVAVARRRRRRRRRGDCSGRGWGVVEVEFPLLHFHFRLERRDTCLRVLLECRVAVLVHVSLHLRGRQFLLECRNKRLQ